VTQQDRSRAGVRSSGEVAAAQVPAGACPAIAIIMITAMSPVPARPAGKPSPVRRRTVC